MPEIEQLRAALVQATRAGNTLAALEIRQQLDALTASTRERRA